MFPRAFVRSILAACCLAAVLLSGSLQAQAAASKTMVVVPGVFFTSNPCALDGQGETVELTTGMVLFFNDENGAIAQVVYQDVTGIGEASGLTYEVSYQENRRSTSGLAAQLTMVSAASRLLEITSLDSNGNATISPLCLSLSAF